MKHHPTLIVSALSILLLLALAAALENLQFSEGYRVDLEGIGAGGTDGSGFAISERVFTVFTSTMMLLSLVFTVLSLFTREGRVRVLTYAAFSAGLAVGFALLLELIPDAGEEVPVRETQQAPGAGGIPGADEGGGIEPDIPEEADERAVQAAVAVAALLAGATAYGLYRKRRKPAGRSVAEDASAAAQAADADLERGADTTDVIIRTYMELEGIAVERLSVSRGTTMTPREFIDSLTRHGIPREPLESLVTLFEQVRYGEARSTDRMRLKARDTLRQIAELTGDPGVNERADVIGE
ncbi:MAG: DUF4129 domain-containing protein [Spirochaetales bacterium]